MYFSKQHPRRVLVVLLLVIPLATHGETLTLQRALETAALLDPGAGQHRHLAQASRYGAIAAGQLPDPVLRFGGMNFPVDTFDRDQEPMTQVQMGIQQMFPPGATLHHRQQEQTLKAVALDALRDDRLLQVRRDTTLAWLDRYYAEHRRQLMEAESAEYERVERVVTFRLESGTATQADLLAVRLAHSRLRDRLAGEQQRIETAIGNLGRWVGWPESSLPLGDLPEEPGTPANMLTKTASAVSNHPRMTAAREQVAAAASRIAQAREAYGASWGVDLAYGARDGHNPDGSRRPDFASAMIMVSLPLFPEKRQDATLAARQAELMAAKDHEREVLLQLREEEARSRAQLTGTADRLRGYAENIIPQAEMQAAATLRAYQSSRGQFEAMLRARLALQSARIEQLNLEHERRQWIARLAYLYGQPASDSLQSGEESRE